MNTIQHDSFGWDLLVYHFQAQIPVVTTAYENKLRFQFAKHSGFSAGYEGWNRGS
jgi:hypothetical protein